MLVYEMLFLCHLVSFVSENTLTSQTIEPFSKEAWEYTFKQLVKKAAGKKKHLEAADGLVNPGDDGGVVGRRVKQVPDEHVEWRKWHLIGAFVNFTLYSVVQCKMR